MSDKKLSNEELEKVSGGTDWNAIAGYCSECKKTYTLKEAKLGAEGALRCPDCGTMLTMPKDSYT